jgi:poly-beta-1,6-N-acetyl-D-glucosamine synthase
MALALDLRITKIVLWVLYFVSLYFSIFWLSILIFNSKGNSKKRRKSFPEVTVLVPLYNEDNSITETLESLFKLDYPKSKLRIICINDGSTDKSSKIMNELRKENDFEIINQKNQGKYKALNNGLKRVTSPFFVVFDADSMIEPHSLKKMLEEFDSQRVAVVMPVMKVFSPQNLLQRVQWLEYQLNIFYKFIMGKLDCIHVTPGPFSIYRTSIIKKLGGFRKGHLTEDLEISLRLQDNHYKLKQSLDGVVYTKSPKNAKAFISQRTRWYQGTMLNIKDYKHFLLNKKYGDFGLFHMPLVAVTGFLVLFGFFIAIYLGIKNLYHGLRFLVLTHFDFLTYFKSLKFNFTLYDVNFQILFFFIAVFGFTVLSIYLAILSSRERKNVFRNIKSVFMFIFFFFIYQFVLGYIWTKVFFKLLFRKTNKWEKVID